jgi:hypothetical protein
MLLYVVLERRVKSLAKSSSLTKAYYTIVNLYAKLISEIFTRKTFFYRTPRGRHDFLV